MSAATVTACIGLGSNLDDPLLQVKRAVDALAAHEAIRVTACSSLYASAPMGPQDQPDYINAVAVVETPLPALSLLDALQAQEAAQARRRGRRWGPRTLDLDLLLYGDDTIRTARLQVPHPGLHLRAFVLYPLAELDPGRRVPGLGRVQELLAACSDDGVRRLCDHENEWNGAS
ncbi:2-amino-4-hydroxy-6-hydroxymethyldihydropteridine diphosphokinase [Aquisalimonas sp.]|uniref:2-amino-4-hydroxy-6- hydroxymethyldihydropteridine diphosphokinase n=1 Tax=unclassified Aquisalimonas TaxID=2644645 RepID=UPI0025BCAF31|nr:2-amino-4-hydroxy-6-hydroxymethyldihydropteridine diphosphokinase [Aquisalimonas sp.]